LTSTVGAHLVSSVLIRFRVQRSLCICSVCSDTATQKLVDSLSVDFLSYCSRAVRHNHSSPLTSTVSQGGVTRCRVSFLRAGTLSNTDPMHFRVFREMLLEKGFNDGVPIDEPFFRVNIAGRHNPDIMSQCFPSWTKAECERFSDEKEANFRALAGWIFCGALSSLLDRRSFSQSAKDRSC
jgi:hypothetical protein